MNTPRIRLGHLLAAGLLAIISLTHAEVPPQLRHEGTVAANGQPFSGPGRFKFAIVDPAGTETYWSHDGSSLAGTEPATSIPVEVTDGSYSVALGDTSIPGMTPVPDAVFSRSNLRLRVWFSDGAHAFQHLTPDEPLVPVAYARLASRVAAGSVTATELAEGAVTPGKLAPGVLLSNLASLDAGLLPVSASPTNPALLAAGFLNVGSLAIPGEAWSERLFPCPQARNIPHVHWSGSEVLLLGGTTTETTPQLVGFRYSPKTGDFAALPTTNAPAFPNNSGTTDSSVWSSAWTGTELLVWNSSARTGRRCDPLGTSWTPMSSEGAPSARSTATAVWTGKEWIVWGGFRGSSSLGDGARYDPTANAWKPMTSVGAPSARDAAWGVWTGSKVLIFAGEVNAPGRDTAVISEVWSYDPEADSWARISAGGITFSSPGMWGAVWTGTNLVVFGVTSPSLTTSLESGAQLDLATGRWSGLPFAEGVAGLRRATAVRAGPEILVWGGIPGSATDGVPSNRGFAFDLARRTWRELVAADAPSPRQYHAAVWTGSEMLVWGGGSSIAPMPLNEGGRYSRDRDRWLPITAAPLRRANASVVWTGSELLVWGGMPGTVGAYAFGSGARWSSATGRWLPMSTRNAPDPRQGASTIWTGREMLVWGGYSADASAKDRINLGLNTGARYDPAADRWSTMTLDDAPSARGEHSAVWTGKEMIVWGGSPRRSVGLGVNTGARYDPVANRWTPVTTRLGSTNLPALSRHAAVWTGRQMIVWGGNPGLRYSPESDSWSTLPTQGAPAGAATSAFGSAAAFWTGNTLLAWAGRWGVYDPYLDSWKLLATSANAPTWGSYSASTMMGSDVLVWGGDSGNALRRYQADSGVWSTVTRVNAPTNRNGHSLVWTGSEALVVAGLEVSGPRTASVTYSIPSCSFTKPLYLYAKP